MKGGLALTLCVLLLAASGCGQDAPGAVPAAPVEQGGSTPPAGTDGVLLTFDGPEVLQPTTGLAGIRVRKLGDAPVELAPSGDGTRALVFPSYRAADEQRLVLVLDGAGGARGRGGSGLTFGADVRLDAGSTSGAQDNGDNVVQRGLFSDEDQFKLQVDHRVPSCSVRTPRGRSVLELEGALDDGWWRLGCAYDGAELRARAEPLGRAGAVRELSRPTRLGALSFAPGTPVSVGGKVTDQGTLVVDQPDQLNGALDNVTITPAP